MADDVYKLIERLIEDNARLKADLSRVQGTINNMFRPGKVTDVDTKKQRARIEVASQDGKVTKSAWIPYGQIAGDYKQHRPPTKGQQFMMMSPDGNFRQAMMMPLTWWDENKSPSEKEDEHVTTYGKKYRLREKKDLREFTLDKVKTTIKPESIKTTINGGNTPKDDNGAKADDNSSNDQEASGTTIEQKEKSIVIKAAEKITLQVGDGVEFELTAAGYTLMGPEGVLAVGGMLYTGVDDKTDKFGQKVMTEGGPAKKHKSRV